MVPKFGLLLLLLGGGQRFSEGLRWKDESEEGPKKLAPAPPSLRLKDVIKPITLEDFPKLEDVLPKQDSMFRQELDFYMAQTEGMRKGENDTCFFCDLEKWMDQEHT